MKNLDTSDKIDLVMFSIMLVMLGMTLGAWLGMKEERKKALNAGAAFWQINATNGEVKFLYGKP